MHWAEFIVIVITIFCCRETRVKSRYNWNYQMPFSMWQCKNHWQQHFMANEIFSHKIDLYKNFKFSDFAFKLFERVVFLLHWVFLCEIRLTPESILNWIFLAGTKYLDPGDWQSTVLSSSLLGSIRLKLKNKTDTSDLVLSAIIEMIRIIFLYQFLQWTFEREYCFA